MFSEDMTNCPVYIVGDYQFALASLKGTFKDILFHSVFAKNPVAFHEFSH